MRLLRVDRPPPLPRQVKAEDPWLDLAVLQIEAVGLTPIEFGDTSNLKKGHLAIVLGNPYAIAKDGQPSAARGIVANLHRPAPPLTEARNGTEQADAAPLRHAHSNRRKTAQGHERRRW